MRTEPRELFRKSGCFCSKVSDRSHSDDTVRMISKDVFSITGQIDSFNQTDREIRCEQIPEFPRPDGLVQAAPFLGCRVQTQDPDDIGDEDGPGDGEGHEEKEEGNAERELGSPQEDCGGLDAPVGRDADGSPDRPRLVPVDLALVFGARRASRVIFHLLSRWGDQPANEGETPVERLAAAAWATEYVVELIPGVGGKRSAGEVRIGGRWIVSGVK